MLLHVSQRKSRLREVGGELCSDGAEDAGVHRISKCPTCLSQRLARILIHQSTRHFLEGVFERSVGAGVVLFNGALLAFLKHLFLRRARLVILMLSLKSPRRYIILSGVVRMIFVVDVERRQRRLSALQA
jgi:hypothetical protein